MVEPADFEIGLHRRDIESYVVELRFNRPDSDADNRLTGAPIVARFDVAHLRELMQDDAAYGQALTGSLFADPAVQQALEKARGATQPNDMPLRLRLFIGPSAPELHALRWETLRDPQDGTPLCVGAQILFSRYLSSGNWWPVRLRPRSALRALVMIANPTNLAAYKFAPVDVAAELDRVRQALGDISTTALDSGGKATLHNLAANLREGYDILYLVAHGRFVQGESWIWLEDEDGRTTRVSGTDIIAELKGLEERPRLIVLASCQSAGSGEAAPTPDNGLLATLGARLAEAGIPAVLAMQGNITMKTVALFMPTFFQELQRDGQIDRAISVARGSVREQPDFWMPILFMRLKSGRLWYVPGFADERGRGDEKWEPLIASVRDQECTPILGPDLTEGLIGPRRELARQLAEDFNFPLAPHNREDLPQVAQYLAVHKSIQYLPHAIVQYLCEAIRRRQGRNPLPSAQAVIPGKASQKELLALLDDLLSAAWKAERERNQAEPHQVLAGLYLLNKQNDKAIELLVQALYAAGKKPEVMLCPWNEYTRQARSPFVENPEYDPTVDRPLVYHLFGRLREQESLVITEDSHFDYLIGVTQYKELIPPRVRSMLADTALLFLGFRPDDWSFRVFFRSLMSQAGGGRRYRYAHIAVQVAPDEDRILLPKQAQRYLEDYFIKGADISIYWGSSEDFIRELRRRW